MGAVIPGRHDLLDETRADPLFLVDHGFDDVPVPLEDLVEPLVEAGLANDLELPLEPALVFLGNGT